MPGKGKSPLDHLKQVIRRLFKRGKSMPSEVNTGHRTAPTNPPQTTAPVTSTSRNDGEAQTPTASTATPGAPSPMAPSETGEMIDESSKVTPTVEPVPTSNVTSATAANDKDDDDDTPPPPPPKKDFPVASAPASRKVSAEVAQITPPASTFESKVQNGETVAPAQTSEATDGTVDEARAAAKKIYMERADEEKIVAMGEDEKIPVVAEDTPHVPLAAKDLEVMSATSGPLEDYPVYAEED